MSSLRLLLASLFVGLLAALAIPRPAPGPADASSAPTPPPLGLNLAGVVDYSTDFVFIDAFKAARAWISQAKGKPWGQGGPLDLDARGNVRSLAEDQYAETVVYTGFEKHFPAGTFTCLYDGDGVLDFAFGDGRVTNRGPGRLTVEIKPKEGSVFCRITKTDPNNPIRNIRLLHPGAEASYQKKPFHPDFLRRWQGFRVFRFMDWQETNNSKLVQWADRPTPDLHSQALKGVALEYMIALCNTQNVEPWFCLPHLASDDFVRQFARMVKKQLKPALKVHVEYSNECWNGQFEQARYCALQGKKLRLSANDYEAQIRFYSQRSVEVFKLWEAEFGGPERLVRVLAMQSANPWTGTTALDWKDASRHTDAVAIAPYFGNRWGDPKTADQTAVMTADALILALRDDVAATRKQIAVYAAEARKRKVQLMAYEGGQHLAGFQGAENNEKLTRLFHEANRHPGMKDLYRQNLKDWQTEGGALFCVFSSAGTYSKWGSWGLLEYPGQDVQTAPKYQAVREYLEGLEKRQ
jgi:hypothetical protein